MPSLQLLAIYPQVKRTGEGVLQPLSKRCDLRLKKGGVSVSREKGKNNKETEK